MITAIVPKTWQTLQEGVAKTLSECGFTVEIEKTIQSARGMVELDVYAEEIVSGRKYVIVCECKHWKNRIPQTVIHSFRTVVSEIGANVGYIISPKGFQRGALKSSDLTNLKLVTWREFQDLFEECWYEKFFYEVIHRSLWEPRSFLDQFFSDIEAFLPKWFHNMSEKDKEAYYEIRRCREDCETIIESFSRCYAYKEYSLLPVRARVEQYLHGKTNIPDQILSENAYREFLGMWLKHMKSEYKKFWKLEERYR